MPVGVRHAGLRTLLAEAITCRIAFAPSAGYRGLTLPGAMSHQSEPRQPLCAELDGLRYANRANANGWSNNDAL